MSILFVKRRGGDYIDCGLVKFERVDFTIQMTDIGTAPNPGLFSKSIVLFFMENLKIGYQSFQHTPKIIPGVGALHIKVRLTHSEIFPGVVALLNEVRFPFPGIGFFSRYFSHSSIAR